MSNLLKKKGSVLVFSLIVLAIVLSSALSITAVNVSNRKSAASTAQSVQSFQTADTATEKVMKAIYNGNYADLTALYNALSTVDQDSQPTSTCPGVLNLTVAGGTAQVKFSDTSGAALTTADCTSTLWRDTLAKVKVEGSGSTGSGAVRVIEVAITPLSSMAWGLNNSNQLGDGTTVEKHTPVSTVGGSRWKSISAGGSSAAAGGHVLAVRADGTLWAWGLNDHGQLGNAHSGAGENKSSPIQIGTDNIWESVSAGENHSLALKTNGTLWAWGNGSNNRLGRGNVGDSDVPVNIGTTDSGSCNGGACPLGWKVISAGKDFSLAIGVDDTLWSWGNTTDGRLGLGASPVGNKPEKIINCVPSCPSSWKVVSAGGNHALAIGTNGPSDNLYSWGRRDYGQLGDGSKSATPQNTPEKIGNEEWISIDAGNNHSLGIKKNTTLWAWGRDNYGQLGDNASLQDQSSPVPVGPGDSGWKSVSGSSHSLALKTDGSLYAWGNNSNGQLGDNSTPYQPSYQVFAGGGTWKDISAAESFSIGIRR